MTGAFNDRTDRTSYDVIVIGGGAGGLNAALVLARARRSVAVIDSGEPRNAPSAHMHSFLSRDGVPPLSVLETGRAEIARYGAVLVRGQADQVEAGEPGGYVVRLAGGATLDARHVVLASGLRDELPDIPGLRALWGEGVIFCPYCHGYEVRDQPLVVLGVHPASAGQALLLRQWSHDVVYVPHTQPLTEEERERMDARGVRVADGPVSGVLTREGRLHAVELADGRTLECAAVFVFPKMTPNDAAFEGLGCARDEAGWLVTDRAGRTSRPGLWAVGNVVDSRAQAVTAAGMGAAAAFALNHDLVDEEIEQAVTAHRASAVTAAR
ncbi:FAD-dependent oxidoreductase [Streptomyces sp. SID8366]|uniref:NAD(P)/FAD-dependent oxidoreductase n=1 Tax=unclassified Streptomyces TaxID=2593676 RepID=UPI000DBA1DE8|nr:MULTISPECIES: NAD(P)/FAD-dependent oxidoreductase [unclassified Streptomyces]MYU05137.1 FAD-dependent oxidoreductase [Streptomyces sp. SID8366]MYU62729.1 FAD-dependent oxidoreductase [Streptomyces sp. SID69]RAJ66014.1 thioredoxin reductase (NADPH) [Streptomyces sp. PsTaAH-130]